MKIAYIGYQVQEKYLQGVTKDEDSELLTFLQKKGLDIHYEIWNNTSVNWMSYDLVILKSPWDYHEHIHLFYEWLDTMDRLGVRLLNAAETLKWNSDKHYLQEISQAGLHVIQSSFLEKGKILTVDDLAMFEPFNTDMMVIKPCVSAGAKNTMVVTRDTLPGQLTLINGLLAAESYMVQPFMPEIRNGEWSFLFFNQQYSHSLLKTPVAGDFRVQHYYGGSISYQQAPPQLIEAATKYITAFAANTLYARVDGIERSGTFYLMELELIEPYLFLDGKEERLENYYQALLVFL